MREGFHEAEEIKRKVLQGAKLKDSRERNKGRFRGRATEANTELRKEQAKIKRLLHLYLERRKAGKIR